MFSDKAVVTTGWS